MPRSSAASIGGDAIRLRAQSRRLGKVQSSISLSRMPQHRHCIAMWGPIAMVVLLAGSVATCIAIAPSSGPSVVDQAVSLEPRRTLIRSAEIGSVGTTEVATGIRLADVQEILFDYARCDPDRFLVYVYPEGPGECFQARDDFEDMPGLLRALSETAYVTNEPWQACVLIPRTDFHRAVGQDHCKMHDLGDVKFWDNGRNHLIFIFSDIPDESVRETTGSAVVAQASVNSLVTTGPGIWRAGHDISIGLFEGPDMAGLNAADKRHLRQGTAHRPLLVSFAGHATGPRRELLAPLVNNSLGVAEATELLSQGTITTGRCGVVCNWMLAMLPISWQSLISGFVGLGDLQQSERGLRRSAAVYLHLMGPEWGSLRREEEANREREGRSQPGYVDLLAGSTFSLCPEGDGKATYRITDSLAVGAIPVVVSEGYVLPFGELEEGSKRWAVVLHPRELHGLAERLMEIPPKEVESMQQQGRLLYERVWASREAFAESTLEVIKGRVIRHYGALEVD